MPIDPADLLRRAAAIIESERVFHRAADRGRFYDMTGAHRADDAASAS